jgi:hypothetical protein
LNEVVLVGGHSLRLFLSLEGEIHGALSGPRGERQFEGLGAEEIEAAAKGWLRIRKRRERGWPRDDGVEFFLVGRRPLFDEGIRAWYKEKGLIDASTFARLSDFSD